MANEFTAPRGLELSSRLLLALMITIFGANKFLGFMPTPAAPEDGAKFLGALFASGYIFNTIGAGAVLAALMLLVSWCHRGAVKSALFAAS